MKHIQNFQLFERKFSASERKQLADKGKAEKDGSFPIKNVTDLKNAIKAFGLSKDKAKTKRWIKKRAKELKAEKYLPASWI